jgi:DNA-binding Lrp family transcriptional regulator
MVDILIMAKGRKRILLTDIDKRVIMEIQGDIPVCERPFEEMAKNIGISEEELLEKIKTWMKKGIIRRFGATLRHQLVGFDANAMSAWRVPNEDVDKIGKIIASYSEVTHCYERPPTHDWPYNLYAMIHGRTVEDCKLIAREISERTGIRDYILLFSSEENKKESMRYF